LGRLDGKVAIITGSAQGIGEGIAHRFAQEGARVVICDINEELVTKVTQDINGQQGNAIGIVADITNAAAVGELIDKVINEYGTIDVLVNNAGITRDTMLHKMSDEQWKMVLNVNLTGTFNCCRAVAPIMRGKNYGKIINISSAARFGNAGQVNYSATKAGVVGITRALAKEMGPKSVNVNAVAPGFIKSAMSAAVAPEIINERLKMTPMHRMGTAEDVANACLFLASDEAAYITGQVIQVDGGRYMP
jgi:NAD(P)-dependent dehydrogenase (short-subunit alcohol dehydrogenase family)